MERKKRWALLEHVDAPDDPSGRHFDLLLESKLNCKTWRLSQFPLIDGPAVLAIPISDHKLEWLQRDHVVLSRGRGVVKRLEGGYFLGDLPSNNFNSIDLELVGETLKGQISIEDQMCSISSFQQKNKSSH